MPDKEYEQVLRENPELFWHPDFMASPECPSRDFKFTEAYTPLVAEDNDD